METNVSKQIKKPRILLRTECGIAEGEASHSALHNPPAKADYFYIVPQSALILTYIKGADFYE